MGSTIGSSGEKPKLTLDADKGEVPHPHLSSNGSQANLSPSLRRKINEHNNSQSNAPPARGSIRDGLSASL